ncbi:lipopolysaccharide transport periplasmic protein LptA [Camelimonas sp. ID_303_24]
MMRRFAPDNCPPAGAPAASRRRLPPDMVWRGALAACIGMAAALLPAAQAGAQPKKPQAAAPAQNQGFAGFGGANSKEPIKIDSDRLDVFDKEKKAIFAGNVVAVQGETTMRCKTLTVFYEQGVGAQGGAKSAPAAQAGGDNNGVRRLECAGPMTVISKDQIATADNATYDKGEQKVYLIGNAKLSQGENVTTGDRLIYDLSTSRASVEHKPGQRVRALLVPGNDDKQQPGKPAKPQPGKQH